MPENSPQTLIQRLAVWLAVGFGSGWAPKAPGTFGSLVGVAVAWLVGQIPAVGPIPQSGLQAAVVVGLCLVGIPIINAARPRLGRGKDPGCVVWDEIAALPITFFLLPMTSWLVVLAGFALFRFFDISKLPPARQLERLPGGLGVMADDWAAAVYSHLALRALLWLVPSL